MDRSEDLLRGTIIGVNAERRRAHPAILVATSLPTSYLVPTSYVVRLEDGREVNAVLDLPHEMPKSGWYTSCTTYLTEFGETAVSVVTGAGDEPNRIVSMDGRLKF